MLPISLAGQLLALGGPYLRQLGSI